MQELQVVLGVEGGHLLVCCGYWAEGLAGGRQVRVVEGRREKWGRSLHLSDKWAAGWWWA